jgi:hypothetical protein
MIFDAQTLRLLTGVLCLAWMASLARKRRRLSHLPVAVRDVTTTKKAHNSLTVYLSRTPRGYGGTRRRFSSMTPDLCILAGFPSWGGSSVSREL